MTSTDDTRANDVFMIVPEADRYRWVGRRSDKEGFALSKVRHAPVASSWESLPVDWVAETKDRPRCDFPIFHPIVRCMSFSAVESIRPYIDGNIELLALSGLGGVYTGIHCIHWLDAADFNDVDLQRTSIHSTMFIPTLKSEMIDSQDIFGVRDMIAKIFVSGRVKQAIESQGLTGCEFYQVPLS